MKKGKRMKKKLLRLFLACCSIVFLPNCLWATWYDIGQGTVETRDIREGEKLAEPEVTIIDEPSPGAARAQSLPAPANESKKTVWLEIEGFGVKDVEEEGVLYQKIIIPGWEEQPEVGKPGVPVKFVLINIPHNAAYDVKVVAKDEVAIEDIYLIPSQPPVPNNFDGKLPFEIDEAAYATDAFFPENHILSMDVIDERDSRMLVLGVSPFRFNPAQRRARLGYALTIEVTLTQDPVLSMLAPVDAPAEGTPSEKYMILMDDQFASSSRLSEFITWKKEKGLDVKVVRTSQVPSATHGAPKATEIINYMRGLPSSSYPDFLLILGNHSESNGVAGTYVTTTDSTSRYGYSDLYTACRTSSDWIPDLYYGRLPASNSSELTKMLEKVLAAEKNPPASGMYDEVLVAGQIQDNDPKNNEADRLFCETADLIATFFDSGFDGYNYSVTNAMVNPHGMTASGHWQSRSILWAGATGSNLDIGTRVYNRFVSESTARSRISNSVNNGVAIVQHRDHGYTGGWGDPRYSYSDVRYLSNGKQRPVVFSVNCQTGAYHFSNCFAKEWLLHANGGAYAVLAAVDLSFSWKNDYLTHAMYMAFLPDYLEFQRTSTYPNWTANLPYPSGAPQGSLQRLGPILNYAKRYVYERYGGNNEGARETSEIFHVFGDPETAILLHAPEAFNPRHDNSTSTGPTTFTVDTGVAESQVCLFSETLGIQAVSRGSRVSFDLNIASAGTLKLTITKPGMRPYQADIPVGDGGAADWIKVDDRDGLIAYDASWGLYDDNPGYLGTEHFCETRGGTAIFTFTGTKARYYGFKRSDLGYADIYLDDVRKATIDCYSANALYDQLLFESEDLPDGPHTLKVVVNGGKNPASSGTEVICDAFAYLSDNTRQVVCGDDFETATIDGGTGWDRPSWYARADGTTGIAEISTRHVSGSYSFRLRGNAYCSRDVHLTGKTNTIVSFWYRLYGFEAGEKLEIQNTDREPMLTLRNGDDDGQWHYVEFDYSRYDGLQNVYIRFELTADSTYDYFYIDDVRFTSD